MPQITSAFIRLVVHKQELNSFLMVLMQLCFVITQKAQVPNFIFILTFLFQYLVLILGFSWFIRMSKIYTWNWKGFLSVCMYTQEKLWKKEHELESILVMLSFSFFEAYYCLLFGDDWSWVWCARSFWRCSHEQYLSFYLLNLFDMIKFYYNIEMYQFFFIIGWFLYQLDENYAWSTNYF